MSPFAKNYKPQIDTKTLTKESAISRNATLNREKMMQSDDEAKRFAASGYIPGMSGASQTFADRKNSKV